MLPQQIENKGDLWEAYLESQERLKHIITHIQYAVETIETHQGALKQYIDQLEIKGSIIGVREAKAQLEILQSHVKILKAVLVPPEVNKEDLVPKIVPK